MAQEDDIQLRLSAQRALLTHITPSMRAVSVEVIPEQRRAWVRFIFDGKPSPDEEETASVAHTEILSDFVDEWIAPNRYTVTRGSATLYSTVLP